jgi:PD-(D/E)XK nuclease superfamily
LQDPYIPQDATHETTDHPVNRYVAWFVARIAQVLGELADALERAARNPRLQPDTTQWCRARACAAASGADELLVTLRRTFLGSLSPMSATETALLAVQDDPVYARAHALARPFLSPRFRLRESLDGGESPIRPSFELYELWTLLAVQQALAEVLDGWVWTWHPVPGNELLAGFGPGAIFTARREDGERLDIRYNVTFPGYLARGNSERYSISGERRPDIVISLERPEGVRSWICIDTKYRVRREAVADAFASLHIYRDSLRWDKFSGPCRSGLLLVPAVDTECAPWFTDEFRGRFGIGAWRLTPGEPSDAALGRLILAMACGPGTT